VTKNTFGWAGPISAASAAAIIALTSTSALAGADYLRIDPTNQLEVAWAWRALLKKAEVTNPEWTGSIAGCNAGSVPYWVGMKTTQAVNWYRAMAGVSAEDTFDPAANAAMQAAALAVVASGGVKYSGGLSNNPAAYTGCMTGPMATGGIQLSIKGYAAGVATNLTALNDSFIQFGTSTANSQLYNRQQLLRIDNTARGVGQIADGAGSTVTLYNNATVTGARYYGYVAGDRTWPRSGYFPAVGGIAPARWHLVNENGSTATVSATVNGVAVTAQRGDFIGGSGVYYTTGTIAAGSATASQGGSLPDVSGNNTMRVIADFTNVRPYNGAGRNRTVDVTFFDPTSLDSNIVESGWYWDPADGGNGVAIEQQGSKLFLAAYTYREDGSPVWYVGNCDVAIGVQSCSGQFQLFQGGKTIVGAGGQAAQVGTVGAFSLSWSSRSAVTMQYPGGTLALERYKPAGPATTDAGSVPQTGWFWDRSSGGEGWFVEVSGGWAYVANYSYNAAGQPVWYVAEGSMSSDRLRLENANLLACSGGRSINQPPGARGITCTAVGTLTLAFSGTDRANVQVAVGGAARSQTIDRFWFNAGSLAP